VTILVIGGNGFIGRYLVKRLLKDNEVSKVISMDIMPPRETFMRSIENYHDKFCFVRGDVSQIEDILTAMKSFSIEKVVNFAYMMSVETQNMPLAAVKVNLLGMCNVFEAARLLDIPRVIYPSSQAIYGGQIERGDREVTEEDPVCPSSSYGVHKLVNERAAARYSEQYGMSIIGLRPAFGFGHGREALGVAKRFSSLVSFPAVGKPVSIEVEGSNTYTLIYIDDIVELTRSLLHASSPKHSIYNIAGPPTSLEQVAEQVRKYIPDAKINFGHENGYIAGPRRISIARAKGEFGVTLTPLKDAVLKNINEARVEVGLELIKP
jgi:nucleoside-diphosphate-sugar epimerase